MSLQKFDEVEKGFDELAVQGNNANNSLTSKLERRRRIEELNEEKRLREELSEY